MPQARISLLAAMDRDHVIGREGQLPWHLPDDLKRFKALTLGRPMLMGRKTAQSLGRALPGRRNLVLSRGPEMPYPGMEHVASLAEAIRLADGDELMVIGGGEVYSLCLPEATAMYLTLIDTHTEAGDAFFPRFDSAQWIEIDRQSHASDERHAYGFEFVDYRHAG